MNRITEIITKNKELLINSAFLLICLALALFFPINKTSPIQALTKGLFFLVVVPSLYIKIILKKDLSDFGFNLKNRRIGIIWGIGMLLTMLLLTVIIIKLHHTKIVPDIPVLIQTNFLFFVFYELIFINILLFTYDFFWRGIILFLYSEKFQFWAVIIQAVIFSAISLLNNDFFWKYYSLPLLSLLSGIVAYKSKSFIYSYAASLFFMIILDSYLIYSLNK